MSEKPQVYVSVLGGIANAEATRGEVDIVIVDWDSFEDNIPTDDEVQWITDGIESLAEPYRTSQLITLKEELDKIGGLAEADRLDAEETRRRELAAERSLLKDAGELT